jgi:hypothetical protein
MKRILRRPVIIGAAIGAACLAAMILTLSLSGGSDPTGGATTAGATTTSSPAAAATSGRKGGGSRATLSAAQLGKRGTVSEVRACERHLPGNGIAIADGPRSGT